MKMACRMQTRQSVPSGPLISEQYIDSWFLSWQDAFEMRLASICAHIYIYLLKAKAQRLARRRSLYALRNAEVLKRLLCADMSR